MFHPWFIQCPKAVIWSAVLCRNHVLQQVIWECSTEVAVLHKWASILSALSVTVLLWVCSWENKADGPDCQHDDVHLQFRSRSGIKTVIMLRYFMHNFRIYQYRRLTSARSFVLSSLCVWGGAVWVCVRASSGTQFEIGAGGREEQDPFWSTTDSGHRASRTWAIGRQGIFAAERPQWGWLPRRCIWWVDTLSKALGTRRRFCDQLPFTLSFTHRTLEYFSPPVNTFGMSAALPALSVSCWKFCMFVFKGEWNQTM